MQKSYNTFIKPIGGTIRLLIKCFYYICLYLIRVIFPKFLSKVENALNNTYKCLMLIRVNYYERYLT